MYIFRYMAVLHYVFEGLAVLSSRKGSAVTLPQVLQKNGPSLEFQGKKWSSLCNFDCISHYCYTINESCVKTFMKVMDLLKVIICFIDYAS